MTPKEERRAQRYLKRGRLRRLFDSLFKYVFCREERRHLFLDLAAAFLYPDGGRSFSSVRFIDRELSPGRKE
ncbi:MAG: hypothetical protein LBR38_00770, partial [Synergistaceae bacterium]|nr:hypothetical protein [Synergistaceae bacterium]